jgi:subtilisin family serine protease
MPSVPRLSPLIRPLLPVAVLVATLALPASESAAGGGRLLVKFRSGVTAGEAASALAADGARQIGTIRGIGVRVVAASDVRGTRLALDRNGKVLFAEPDDTAEPQETVPDDPYFPQGTYSIQSGAWGWYRTHTTRAWDVTEGDAGVTIAILDTGLKSQSLDFDGQLVAGYNVLNGNTDTVSGAGNHGTYVAGVAGLAINTGSGNAGYCPRCKIMPVQVGTDSGASYSDIATGIVWAADHGARVVNLSWAGAAASSTLANAVAYARSRGAVVFAAAGNSNCDCPTYPSATPGVLGVAGVSSSGAKAGDSNFGSWVAVAAPEGNMTAWPAINGAPGYGAVGGTSLASPAAAGIAGLLLSANPALSGAQVEQVLQDSATPASFPVAHGVVDAMAALGALGFSDPQAASVPLNTIAPQVLVATNGNQNTTPLGGAPQPDQVLVRGQGAWSGSSPLSLSAVRWYRCSAGGSGCTQVGSSWKYTVQPEDSGYALKLTVTFTDPDGTSSASAPLTAPVGEAPPPAPANTAPPTVSGTPEEGQVLTASSGSWSGSPAVYAYQWRRCDSAGANCVALAGATAQTYRVGSADIGSTLRVEVTASNPSGSATAGSAATAVVQGAPLPPPPPPVQTQTLTFSSSLSSKAPSKSYSVTVAEGLADARLSFSKCSSLTLAVKPFGGSTLASVSGPSVLALSRTLAAGVYTYVVSGASRCSFTLTVTSPAP